jgi:Zn-dependent protease
MSRTIFLGKLAGLKINMRLSVLPALILLWLALAAIGIWGIKLTILAAVLGGLLAALLHPVSEFWHQLGHSVAARATGFPMSGILFWGLLGTSIYPPKERKLAAQIHIRRALGGPTASFVLALFAGVLAVALRSVGNVTWWSLLFFFLDNLLIFTLGSLLPLGFTDGSTLLYWSKHRNVQATHSK